MGKIEIIIYSSKNCHHCTIVKEFLETQGFEFEIRNIANKYNRKELMELGFMSVPVTIINGRPILGSDLNKLIEVINEELER
ncbi:MAG: glutaredoxin-like protein [Candidatus Izimaplasma bacterium HR2]|nr:MAG: glutaredoxin-like protein [Candidatus Izimaplasma bacterium HR2]